MIEEENGADARLQAISAAIRVVPHFPQTGIMFNDITTLLLRPKLFKDAVSFFVDRYRDMGISAVAGIEARGFFFGPSIALAIGAKFIPLQKPKKLTGEVFSEVYELEYGNDCLELHVGAVKSGERVLIFDDVIATGGTLCAAMKLIEQAGGEVVECACLIGTSKFKIIQEGAEIENYKKATMLQNSLRCRQHAWAKLTTQQILKRAQGRVMPLLYSVFLSFSSSYVFYVVNSVIYPLSMNSPLHVPSFER